MASSDTFHLLTNPPVASAPGGLTIISATSPGAGRLTTMLLDPAVPPDGAAQYLAEMDYTENGATKNIIYGRWITRMLPAQTIGAGNWTFYAALRLKVVTSLLSVGMWGFCVAQWRAGTGVVARFLDAPIGGVGITPSVNDFTQATTVAGSALTLAQNDQIVLEVWSSQTSNNEQAVQTALLLNGRNQYVSLGTYPAASLTDTDAFLQAPAPIVYL